MLKRFFTIASLLCACLAPPASAIDLNQADEAQLLAIKGLGPTRVHALLEERQANGPFTDADDVVARVKGIGPKTVARLQSEGLDIGAGPGARP